MKTAFRCLRNFALPAAVCLFLILAEIFACLCVPALVNSAVQNGVLRSGLDAGAPRAMSRNAMELLKSAASAEDAELLERSYFTFDVGSSESYRYESEYPLARSEAICVMNPTLSEEEKREADRAYRLSAHTFLLYTGQNADVSVPPAPPEESASSSESLDETESTLEPESSSGDKPDGYIGEIPEGAIFDMPEARAADMSGTDIPDNTGEGYILDEEASSEILPETTPPPPLVADIDISQPSKEEEVPQVYLRNVNRDTSPESLYSCVSALKADTEGVLKAREQALEAFESMDSKNADVTFKLIFYKEMGMDLSESENGYIWRTFGTALLAVLGALAAAAALLFMVLRMARLSVLKTEQDISELEADERPEGKTVSEFRSWLLLVPCAAIFMPLMILGSALLSLVFASGEELAPLVPAGIAGLILMALAAVLLKIPQASSRIHKLYDAFIEENDGEKQNSRKKLNAVLLSAFYGCMPFLALIVSAVCFSVTLANKSGVGTGEGLVVGSCAVYVFAAFLVMAAAYIPVFRGNRATELLDKLFFPAAKVNDEAPEETEQTDANTETDSETDGSHTAGEDPKEENK